MSGYTAHKNIYFDVPFISHIEGNLYQGGCEDGLDLPEYIEHVVSLYPWERYREHSGVRSTLQMVMHDSTSQDLSVVDSLARWVIDRSKEGPVLVNCQAGLNRSGLVMARVLMLQGRGADEAIELIRTQRSEACLCNPAFEQWLRGLDSRD